MNRLILFALIVLAQNFALSVEMPSIISTKYGELTLGQQIGGKRAGVGGAAFEFEVSYNNNTQHGKITVHCASLQINPKEVWVSFTAHDDSYEQIKTGVKMGSLDCKNTFDPEENFH